MCVKVQIYVPSCNYGRYLSQALESVVNQTFNDWHCYIIDEASTDNTEEIAMQYTQKFGDEKFIYVKNSERVGLQKLSNWVFKNTVAPYVIRLDADDYWMPHLLDNLYKALIKNSAAALAFGGFTYVSESGSRLVTEPSVNYLNRYMSGLDSPHGACTLIDREKFLQEGLYYEVVDAQDGWDLWLKCYPKYEFVVIEEPLFFYRQHHNSLSRNSNRILRARRKLVKLNLNTISDKKVQVVIPIGINLDFESKPVQDHFEFLQNKINESENLVQPLLTVDDARQYKTLLQLNLGCEVFYTDGRFKYGMNPFKLLDQIPLKYDAKMWLNFNAKLIDGQMFDDAISTLWKFNLDTCISVVEQREPVFKLTADGLHRLSNGRYADYKIKADELWRMNNILVLSTNEESSSVENGRVGYFEMSAEESILINEW